MIFLMSFALIASIQTIIMYDTEGHVELGSSAIKLLTKLKNKGSSQTGR